MPPHPYEIRADIALLWTKALGVASGAATVWPVRGHAAAMCLLLAAEVDYDDALALAAVAVASTVLECSPYAHDLLVAAREIARDESVLLDPMLALAAAHAAGRHDAVLVALLELLQIADPKPFVWTKTADQILAKIARFARRTLEDHGVAKIDDTSETGH